MSDAEQPTSLAAALALINQLRAELADAKKTIEQLGDLESDYSGAVNDLVKKDATITSLADRCHRQSEVLGRMAAKRKKQMPCPTCGGDGTIHNDMHYSPDTCHVCKGSGIV